MRIDSVQGKSNDIRFVAAQTRSPAKSESYCRDRGIEIVPRFEDVLARRDIDAVLIATPNSMHADQVARAAAAGKHVFVEKPLALSLADAEKAVTAVRKAGVALGIGFQRRFYPNFEEVRTRLKDGRLGTLGAMIAEQTGFAGLFMRPDDWRADGRESPGGMMSAIGIHFVDLMIALAGRVRQVDCVNERRASAVDDTTSVLLTFENGVAGELFCSCATANYSRFAVYGSRALAEMVGFSGQRLSLFAVPDRIPERGPHAMPEPEIIKQNQFDGLAAATNAFAQSVLKGTPFPISREEILHGIAVFDAIVESGLKKHAVAVRGAHL
jgi:predicted dehydrogenase